MNKSIHWRAVIALGGLLSICSQGALGDVSVKIKGVVLMPPPCVVNNGGTVNVNFGTEIMTTKIDGLDYRWRPVPYTVSCGQQPTNSMTLEIKGVGAGFDSKSLGTSKSDLGIRFLVGGEVWPLNKPLNYTHPTLPAVKAVLVKKAGNTLTGGTFSAAATLVHSLR